MRELHKRDCVAGLLRLIPRQGMAASNRAFETKKAPPWLTTAGLLKFRCT
jgi:hypothetical protein